MKKELKINKQSMHECIAMFIETNILHITQHKPVEAYCTMYKSWHCTSIGDVKGK